MLRGYINSILRLLRLIDEQDLRFDYQEVMGGDFTSSRSVIKLRTADNRGSDPGGLLAEFATTNAMAAFSACSTRPFFSDLSTPFFAEFSEPLSPWPLSACVDWISCNKLVSRSSSDSQRSTACDGWSRSYKIH